MFSRFVSGCVSAYFKLVDLRSWTLRPCPCSPFFCVHDLHISSNLLPMRNPVCLSLILFILPFGMHDIYVTFP